jgi:FAD/FMN-containing dehydrogenase
MSQTYDVAGFRTAIGQLKCEDNPVLMRQKSRDFYWYSPVLKRQLDHVCADLIVTPQNEGEVIETLQAAHRFGIPVTPRGAGTGNYGQAMPLSGGIVLNLAEMNKVTSIRRGRVVSEPGAILKAIDAETRASGQELRMHPSTYATASIGGFIAGGSGGVGSINWGGLRDVGNILRLRIVTMEARPRILELTGEDLQKAVHAYGTNGIITEVEMPLTEGCDWIDVIAGFASYDAAAHFALALGEEDGILVKLIALVASPAPHDFFLRHAKFLPRESHVVILMIAEQSLDAFQVFARRWPKVEILFDASRATEDERKGLPPNYELTWNHTTLRALRVDPAWTYLQARYAGDAEGAARIHAQLADEAIAHLEFIRFNGQVGCAGLPLVRFSTEERLDEIVALHEAEGAAIFNPHRYTLEEGGMKQTDSVQLAFKRQTDPDGLLNPGKMIAWDDPDFDFGAGRNYLFPGLEERARAGSG